MASQIALDYGGTRLRVLEFDGSVRKLRVLSVVDVDLDVPASEDEEFEADDMRAQAIAEAVKSVKLTTDPSAMAFDAGSALFREFDLPFTSDEQIEKVVRFEAESHIPLDLEDVVIQHVVLRKTREKSHVLAAAIQKDDLLDRFDILDEAGIDPHFVDMDVFCLYQALVDTGVAAEHPNAVVVSAQSHATVLLFLVEGKLWAVRSLRMGTHGIHEAGSSEVESEDLEAARAHDFLGRLGREIRRTMTSLPGAEFTTVLATGSGSRIPGFVESISEAFSLPAEPLDLLERVDHKLDEDEAARFGPDIGVALGTAYKLLGSDQTGTDFRREECAYARKFDQVKSPLIALAFLVFLIVALDCIDEIHKVRKLRTEYNWIVGDAGQALEVNMGDVAKAKAVYEDAEFGPRQVQAISLRVDREFNDLAAKLGRSEAIPTQPSALAVWIEFSEAVLDNEERFGRFFVSKLDIDVGGRNPELKIAGVMEDRTRVDMLVQLFENDPLYSEVTKVPSTQANDEGLIRFDDIIVTLDLDELEARVEEGRRAS